MLCNMVIFYGEEFLAPCPILKVEEHPLSAVRYRFSIYLQLPSISRGHFLICNLRVRHAVVTGIPL